MAYSKMDKYLFGDTKRADDVSREFGSLSDSETDSTEGPWSSEQSDLEVQMINSSASTSRRNSSVGFMSSGKLSFQQDRPRYLVSKLETWFREVVDPRGSGQVKLREFVMNLRSQDALQAILCEVAGVSFTAEERQIHARLSTAAPLGLCAQERADALVVEAKRLRQIFWEACACACDAGGDPNVQPFLDLPTFLALFRVKGFVLE